MAVIELTRGLKAIVDDDLAECVDQFKWYANRQGNGFRAKRAMRREDGTWTSQYLHHAVWKCSGRELPDGNTLDHRNRNPLDNRIENLRPATQQQQNHNRQQRRDNTSGFIGVTRNGNKWHARGKISGKTIHLGYFTDPVDAARTYDAFARENYGEFAVLNFP
jgi:hypothetical protein